MSLNDSSAIILIVGALAVIAFVIHGLWFSGRSSNRRLSKTSKEDQALEKAPGLGKVRIVTPEMPSDEQAASSGGFRIQDSSVHEEPRVEFGDDGKPQGEVPQMRVTRKLPSSIEINLASPEGREYRGEDIDAIVRELRFSRDPSGKIFIVSEGANGAGARVFALCPLKEPYTFPSDLAGFTTPKLAFYMKLPAPGKARDYMMVMRTAAQMFADRLGGGLQDNSGRPLTAEILDKMEDDFRKYDGQDSQEAADGGEQGRRRH
ncbi:MAG: cell division protein ZipA C-terminal FtsZ-binding domain-containing protein [Succinivibrio sp.]